MSLGRRLIALAAVSFIAVAALFAAVQWVRDLSETEARFVTSPVVVAAQGALRPVEGRPLEWWGKTTRRTDKTVGPAGATAAICVVVLAGGFAMCVDQRRLRLVRSGAAHERAPPLLLVH